MLGFAPHLRVQRGAGDRIGAADVIAVLKARIASFEVCKQVTSKSVKQLVRSALGMNDRQICLAHRASTAGLVADVCGANRTQRMFMLSALRAKQHELRFDYTRKSIAAGWRN